MRVNPDIFKAYDIRGIYPQDLDEEISYKIGRAFVEYTKAQEVVVGQDMRLSSPQLLKALTKGIIDQGADVLNIGLISIDCLYFTVGHYKYEGGIMITASHNPKDYNGFKMVKREAEIIRGTEIYKWFKKADFPQVKNRGKIHHKDIWQDYLNHIFSFVDLKKIKPFKVVVDAGNGMAGKVIPLLELKLPIEIIPLNFRLDGNFPNHPSNPLAEGAAIQVSQAVKDRGADFGFIFDGDTDRIFLIDELGNFVKADITLLFLAKHFLEKNPGAGIVYNLICSHSVPEFIKKWGGRTIRTAVGYVNIRKGMEENNGIFGGELSAHYCFRDNFYSDSGFIAFLILLQLISESDKKVSKMVSQLTPYVKAPEVNLEIENKEKVLTKTKEIYSDGKQDFLDGVTVEYKDWWFNLRLSNTEPLIRLVVEAKTKELMEKKKKEIIEFIKKI